MARKSRAKPLPRLSSATNIPFSTLLPISPPPCGSVPLRPPVERVQEEQLAASLVGLHGDQQLSRATYGARVLLADVNAHQLRQMGAMVEAAPLCRRRCEGGSRRIPPQPPSRRVRVGHGDCR
eukprot:5651147-Prymnesium_polylepis.1